MEMEETYSACARCGIDPRERICISEDGKGPPFCPTLNRGEVVEEAVKVYEECEWVKEFARQASIQEAECYAQRGTKPYVRRPVKPRLQEICEFAHKMGYKRIGLAFCVGLRREAAILSRILERQGFEVVSVICKVGRVPKERIGVKDEEKIDIGAPESMCNPIAQAKILNQEKTQFNILLGLCVGHDSLFFKYAQAPTTVFAVKDRVLGHNPLAALYTAESYYERLMQPGF